jgi:5'-nucleotidase
MKTLLSSVVILFLISCFSSCRDKLEIQSISGQNIEINDSISDHTEINDFIEPYKSSIEDEMNRPLSYTFEAMYKSDTPYNTAIGNMMADAVFELANPVFYGRTNDSIDGVLLNYGGIRAGIDKGVITTETAYNIMPFENMVVIAKLKGIEINEMFKSISESKRAQPISNLKISVDKDWNLIEYTIGNKKVEASQYYYIATSDYVLGNLDFFQKADTVYQTDYKLRNLFIDYFKRHDTINAKADNRFQKNEL